MPILDVQIVLSAAQSLAPDAASMLADDLGAALGVSPGRLWVRLHRVARQDYAENGVALEEEELPVFVAVLHARPPEGKKRAEEVANLTPIIARVLGRSADRVHIEYAVAGAGRIAFGGRLVE